MAAPIFSSVSDASQSIESDFSLTHFNFSQKKLNVPNEDFEKEAVNLKSDIERISQSALQFQAVDPTREAPKRFFESEQELLQTTKETTVRRMTSNSSIKFGFFGEISEALISPFAEKESSERFFSFLKIESNSEEGPDISNGLSSRLLDDEMRELENPCLYHSLSGEVEDLIGFNRSEYLKEQQELEIHPRSLSPVSSDVPSSPNSTSSSDKILTRDEILLNYERIIATIVHTHFQAVMLLTTGKIVREDDTVDTAWSIVGNIVSSIPFFEGIGEGVKYLGQEAHQVHIDSFNDRFFRNITLAKVDLIEFSSSIAKMWIETHREAIIQAVFSLQIQDGSSETTIDRMLKSALNLTEACIKVCRKENLQGNTLRNLAKSIKRNYTFTGEDFFISRKNARKYEEKRAKSKRKSSIFSSRRETIDLQENTPASSKIILLEEASGQTNINKIQELISKRMIGSLDSL